MGLFDFLTEGETNTQSLSTLSTEQQGLSNDIIEFLQSNIGKGATPYPGELPGAGEIPGLLDDAFSQFESRFNDNIWDDVIQDYASGKPSYEFNPDQVINFWEETYSKPIMQAWQSSVAPILENQYNQLPGNFYSTRTGKGVADAANQFYSSSVQPTLFNALQRGEERGFQAGETAVARRGQALNMPGQQFASAAQAILTKMGISDTRKQALYSEFLRTNAEPGWAVNAATGFLNPTMENVVTQESSLLEQVAPIAGMALGGWAGGGFAGLGAGTTTGGVAGQAGAGIRYGL